MAAPLHKLEYFDIEGRGEKVRLAFLLAGIPFEDVRLAFQDWAARKPSTKFGQLPALTLPSGEEFYQSDAMLRYVGSLDPNGKLYPADPIARLSVDEALGLGGDMDSAWGPCFRISRDPEAFGHPADLDDRAKAELVKEVRTTFMEKKFPAMMQLLTAALEKTGAFLCGPDPTVADCQMLPTIRYYMRGIADFVPTDCVDAFPVVKAYVDRCLALPALQAHYAGKK